MNESEGKNRRRNSHASPEWRMGFFPFFFSLFPKGGRKIGLTDRKTVKEKEVGLRGANYLAPGRPQKC